MNTIKNMLYRMVPVVLLMAIWVSCKDDEIADLNLTRQFKPSTFSLTSGETSAIVSWSPSLFTIEGEVEYVLEVSKTQDFALVEKVVTTTSPEVTIYDTEIDIRVNYFARVKALGKNGTGDSNWLISNAFRITGEVFILPISPFYILTESVLIEWIAGKDIASIVLTPQSGTPIQVDVSPAEANAGEKLVEGLTEGTTYNVELFSSDNVSKGSLNFKTKSGFGTATIIDLRGIAGRPKVLVDTLPIIPDHSVVLLKRGQIYTVDNTDVAALRTLTKSVTITSGDDLIPEFASLHTTTFFNVSANSIIDSIVFRDINIKGVRASGASFDNDYIINANVVTSIGKVRLENCNISRLRGVVRLQTGGAGANIANYFINNCKVDSIREFAVVMASAASSFTNVKISNSTFYKCRRFVDHRVTGNSSLVIENCTFNELPTGEATGTNNYFIDFNTFGTSITINNSIIGKTWEETVGNLDVRGIRAGVAANVTNTYTLSDFISANETFQIPGVTPYSGSSTAVYTDPAVGNFLIKDNSFPGRSTAGDPRWRQ